MCVGSAGLHGHPAAVHHAARAPEPVFELAVEVPALFLSVDSSCLSGGLCQVPLHLSWQEGYFKMQWTDVGEG